jgi:hypothetical protein
MAVVEKTYAEVLDQIRGGQARLGEVMHQLKYRLDYHDQSALQADERTADDLSLHYERNTDHPEHHVGGVSGMCLLDVLEWIASEKAARGEDFCVVYLTQKYGVSGQLADVLINTVGRMGWQR